MSRQSIVGKGIRTFVVFVVALLGVGCANERHEWPGEACQSSHWLQGEAHWHVECDGSKAAVVFKGFAARRLDSVPFRRMHSNPGLVGGPCDPEIEAWAGQWINEDTVTGWTCVFVTDRLGKWVVKPNYAAALNYRPSAP